VGLGVKTRKLVFGDQIVEISLSDDTSEDRWQEVISMYSLPDNRSLDELKAVLVNKIYEYAKTLYSDLISDYSLAEAASWTKKEQESRAYLETGVATVSLKAEALSRYNLPDHKAMAKLATIVVTKANYLHQQNSKIAGARGRHIDAIAQLQSKQEVENYNWIEGWN